MSDRLGKGLFALPPGVDFPAQFVAGLLERTAAMAPEDFARVTIYLNSERMRRSVTDALVAKGARLLPRLRLVTDPFAGLPVPGMPQPVSTLRRQLELAQLVRPLLDRRDALSPSSTAFAMAESLAELLAEMQTESVSFAAISSLDVSGQSDHWARALAFLSIIDTYLGPDASPDPAATARSAVEALSAGWDKVPPKDPVIVAGSTGSRGSTALLIRKVALLPQGSVVLPGFDWTLTPDAWAALSDAMSAEDHPQFRFRHLCEAVGTTPDQVQEWTTTAAPAPDRNRVVSLALRPAPITDQWLVEGKDLPVLTDAMLDVTLIEAPSPRGEALAIALILRNAAEHGVSAALVTPDRMLTRQVTAALDRWGIVPDDSAGRPLGLSAPGRLVQQVAQFMGKKPMLDTLLALLKHPLSFSGGDRPNHLRLTRDLELALRKSGPVFPDGASILAWARVRSDAETSVTWAAALSKVLDLAAGAAGATLSGHVGLHRGLVEALARGEASFGTGDLWDKAAGQAVRAAMDALATEADAGGTLSVVEYIDLVTRYLARGEVRDPTLTHPGIRFFGTIEARVLDTELVILGGLNEGIWPDRSAPDPWLNRAMRQKAGLLLPERRIGLAAHDFQLAIAAPRVVLSRACRDADSETVASRWINRLTNLLSGLPDRQGPQALAAMRARGKIWEDRAAALERPLARHQVSASPRPSPRPPMAHRPQKLSLTQIETLIRDPYAIYARHILRLRPLDPMRPSADPRLRGTVLHSVMEQFVRDRPPGEVRAVARDRFLALTGNILQQEVAWPSARILWQARMEGVVDAILDFEETRAGVPVSLEKSGSLTLSDLSFHLVGRPDRIDILPSGRALLIDYKSGEVPTRKQQLTYAQQLLLAAVMAEDGAFPGLGRIDVERVLFLGLKGDLPDLETPITPELLEHSRKGLHNLIGKYARQTQGYTARRAMFKTDFPGDYDVLSRFGEWDLSDPPAPEDVG